MADSQNPWIEAYEPRPHAEIRLFCFPYAGAAAPLYRSWCRALPEWIEVLPVQLPGRWGRQQEPAFTQLAPLRDALLSGLQPLLNKPYAFFGHSMGALLAFELARGLRQAGQKLPRLLSVSAYQAPQASASQGAPWHVLPESEFIEKLRGLDGVPKEILEHPGWLKFFLPTVRADLAVVETYQYKAESPLECPILAFAGLEDPEVRPDLVAAWKDQTSGEFYFHPVSGGHFYLEAQREQILKKLETHLLNRSNSFQKF